MDKFYGENIVPFVGVVEHVVDSSYVRVRVFGIHPLDKTKVRTDQLPPALVIFPTTGGQVMGGSISHNIEVDSWVTGMFLDYPICMQPVVTGVINGSTYSMSTYPTAGGEFVGQGNSQYNENIPVDTSGTLNIPGDNNVQKTYNYTYAKLEEEGVGNLHVKVSGLCGVLLLETPGINPAVVGGYKGRAWGICQWLGSRREQLFARYGQTKRLDQQLDFMWWELNNTERRAKSMLVSANTVEDAARAMMMFERAEEVKNGRIDMNHFNARKRIEYAWQTFNSVRYTGQPQQQFMSGR